MKRNSLFKANVALAALQPGADPCRIAARFGVAVADVEAWTDLFSRWAQDWARRNRQ